jgi:hypothetical protein
MREHISQRPAGIPALQAEDRVQEPALPGQPDKTDKTDSGTVIMRAKIPAPRLPERLHKPPAATSNVALTRDTQTFTAVDLKAAESPESGDSAAHHEWQESHDHAPAKEDNTA